MWKWEIDYSAREGNGAGVGVTTKNQIVVGLKEALA